jgi:uncharacterized protein (DUF362 family)
MATVVIERLSPGAYLEGCASLGRDYGSEAWEGRPEVSAIRAAVFAALDRLASDSAVMGRLRGRPVLVKPNLVTVYQDMGLLRRSSPETTDPRVLDALVLWLARVAASVTIVESSGRGAPTRGSFAVSGIDRLARHRGCGLMALDEEAVNRYILPKAQVQREILVPRPFSAVVRGEAAYVSVPKLKTNLYTGVTLGFKNAMGVIPYNLRQRDHHYDIDRKLVEMLYLFRPDLVLIDGVVGGEGECPAPVDPVDSRMVIAGDHPVETDRVATGLMGFEPSTISLLSIADELGFGDPEGARVIGDASPVPFRPADASLISPRVRAAFPQVKVLIGVHRAGAAPGGAPGVPAASASGAAAAIDPAFVRRMEAGCRGGCIATTRFAFSMFEAEGVKPRRPVVLIVGRGVGPEGGRLWYDADGAAYDTEAIAALPGRKLVVGSCAKALLPLADRYAAGCMPMPNSPHMLLHELSRTPCRVMSLRNRNLFRMLVAILGQRAARRRLIESGQRLDVGLGLEEGRIEVRALADDEKNLDWLPWPLPALGPEETQRLLAFEDDAALAAFRGILTFRVKERVVWRLKAVLTAALTLAPLALAGLSAAGPLLGLSWPAWLAIFGLIELVHCLEIPAARRACRRAALRQGRAWTGAREARVVAGALLVGYPSWVPEKYGVFD